jgi:hypothetical protein
MNSIYSIRHKERCKVEQEYTKLHMEHSDLQTPKL